MKWSLKYKVTRAPRDKRDSDIESEEENPRNDIPRNLSTEAVVRPSTLPKRRTVDLNLLRQNHCHVVRTMTCFQMSENPEILNSLISQGASVEIQVNDDTTRMSILLNKARTSVQDAIAKIVINRSNRN